MRRCSARSSIRLRAVSTSGSSGTVARSAARQRGAFVVEAQDPDGAFRRRVQAQAAQHALVEVVLLDGDAAAADGVDVDRADLGERRGQRGVAGDGVVDLDRDEGRVGPHAALLADRRSRIMRGISEISSATVMPASASRATFSVAVSSRPSTIVPAWPKLMPGISSMKRPAMKAP